MKAFIRSIRDLAVNSPLTRHILEANELYLAVALMLLWPLHGYILRLLDDTAAPLDSGILSVLYAAAIFYSFLRGFVWFGQRINIPFLWVFSERLLSETFKALTPKEQCEYAQRQQLGELALACICLLAAALLAG